METPFSLTICPESGESDDSGSLATKGASAALDCMACRAVRRDRREFSRLFFPCMQWLRINLLSVDLVLPLPGSAATNEN